MADILQHKSDDADVLADDPCIEYINCPNGLLHWRTGTFTSHTPYLASRVQIAAEWIDTARCPAISAWLLEVMPADAIDTFWEIAGYCLLNDNPLHKAVMIFGTGRNGKGTL